MSIDSESMQMTHKPLIAPEDADAGYSGEPQPKPVEGRQQEGVAAAQAEPGIHVEGTFDMEVLVGYILLIGVLTSIALILGGLAWHWLQTGQIGVQYRISGMNFFEFLFKDLAQLFGGQLRPRLFVSLGIAMLMLTPFVRVLASMVYFLVAARNWKYTVFTGFVLAVLTYSLFLR
jgi:uncharacterized membrane protein